jgi:hypothetical protein
MLPNTTFHSDKLGGQQNHGMSVTLLTLPAEIRNVINSYALSASGDLHLVLPTDQSSTGPKIPDSSDEELVRRSILTLPTVDSENLVDFNQLKYVCRQLYAETAGIELKFNDLSIRQKSDLEGTFGTRFQTLMRHVEPRIHWLSGATIVLEGSRDARDFDDYESFHPCTADVMNRTIVFCKSNPKVNVTIISRDLGTHCSPEICCVCFLAHGIFWTWALRGVDHSGDLPSEMHYKYAEACDKIRRRWLGSIARDDILAPSNFRVHPGNNAEYQACLRETIRRYAAQRAEWKETLEAKWMSHISRWYSEGI